MDIREMIAVVQHYINVRKDIQIEIDSIQFNHPMAVVMLQDAYTQAMRWFQANGLTINLIR